MSRIDNLLNKPFRLVGLGIISAVAVVGLIRCVPGDQTVISDEKVSEKLKEAEAAEEQEALAIKAAHGEEVPHGETKGKKGHGKTSKSEEKTKTPKTASNSHAGTHAEPKGNRAPASKHEVKAALYVVQVGAFKVKENAEKLTAKLKEAGYPVRMQSMSHSKNGELHLVRFDPTPNKTEAEQAIETLKSKESMTAQIVAVPAGT